MSVSESYKRFVLDQFEELGDVTPRSMFGGVGLYHRDVFFGIVAGDVLYLKVDDATRGDYERAGMGPFKPYPDRGGTMPNRQRINVVLPEPLGPSTPTTSPPLTSTETDVSTSRVA